MTIFFIFVLFFMWWNFQTNSLESSKTTYCLYKGVDNTVKTFTMHISFNGIAEHEAVYKFVLDSANYTLAQA